MAASSSATLLKTPRRMRLPVISAKKRSTRFSQDDEVGMKCNVKRGCPLQPCFHLIGLVGCVVVNDELEVEMLGYGSVDLF